MGENKNTITFQDLKITRQFLNAIDDCGYTTPTPIQEKAIPLVQDGQDVLGIAQTGTGKTAAFVLPILQKLKYAQGNSPRAIILTPSKELALQIEENVINYAKYTDLRSLCLYGGVGPKTQIEKLTQGVDLIICTPARLLDLYSRNALDLKQVKTMVMDEVDKLMDMGFMPQIRNILEVVPNKRQNLLFSATFPDKVERLSQEFLDFPVRIEAAPQATTASTISQFYYPTDNFKAKIELLGHLLKDEDDFRKVIIFSNSKKTADNVFKYIHRKITEDVKVIHSNKGQNVRINAINAFKNDELRILVTTDVSARGIDVPEVSHVINFEVPYIFQEYVHRIGRTGRAFKVGKAISFAHKGEKYYIKEIESLIGKEIKALNFPQEVKIEPTPKEEIIEIERLVDKFKRWKNPDYKGAFHDKKSKAQKAEDAKTRNKGNKIKVGNRRKPTMKRK